MNFDERLSRVADGYRAQGYQVVVRPGPAVLPPFAKDFQVEILATRPDGNALVSVKGTPSEMKADPRLSEYAGVLEKQPGWRFDLFVLEPDPQWAPEKLDAKEPSEEQMSSALEEAERLLRTGFVAPAFTAAWAALESVMRHAVRAQGGEVRWRTSPQTLLNELVSDGALSLAIFRELEAWLPVRDALVHGFAPLPIEPAAVQALVDAGRQLLEESRAAKQPA